MSFCSPPGDTSECPQFASKLQAKGKRRTLACSKAMAKGKPVSPPKTKTTAKGPPAKKASGAALAKSIAVKAKVNWVLFNWNVCGTTRPAYQEFRIVDSVRELFQNVLDPPKKHQKSPERIFGSRFL